MINNKMKVKILLVNNINDLTVGRLRYFLVFIFDFLFVFFHFTDDAVIPALVRVEEIMTNVCYPLLEIIPLSNAQIVL